MTIMRKMFNFTKRTVKWYFKQTAKNNIYPSCTIPPYIYDNYTIQRNHEKDN